MLSSGERHLIFSPCPQGQLEAHQEESMVISHMAVAGVGLWIAFTTGSTLRLFHTETLEHLQDVNIAAPVHHMLPGVGGGSLLGLHVMKGGGRLHRAACGCCMDV